MPGIPVEIITTGNPGKTVDEVATGPGRCMQRGGGYGALGSEPDGP